MNRLHLPLRYDMKLYVDSCARTVNIEACEDAGREGRWRSAPQLIAAATIHDPASKAGMP
jgi:hypothetical protein